MIPDGYAGYVFPRSSMAAKGLVCELPPIDSGYRGEIHAIISNVSSESQILRKDTRVGQLVITPVLIINFFNKSRNSKDSLLCLSNIIIPLFYKFRFLFLFP